MLQSLWCQFKALAVGFLQKKIKRKLQVGPQAVNYHRDAVKVWNPVVHFSLVPPVGSASNDHKAQRHWTPLNIWIRLESVGMEVLGKEYFLKNQSASLTIQTDVCTCKMTKTLYDAIPSFLEKQWKKSIILQFLPIIFSFWSSHSSIHYCWLDCTAEDSIHFQTKWLFMQECKLSI